MNTLPVGQPAPPPLLAALQTYAGRNPARFHMPGHKGVLSPPFDGIAPLDVTELKVTGDLYCEEDGAIRRAERSAAALYGAKDCFFLTGGATQGIYSMLAAAARPGQTVYADRNSHRSVYNALALLDLNPVWFRGEPPENPGVPLIYTSPDYYGAVKPASQEGAQASSLPPAQSKTDKSCLRLCDAAHGAHLPFILDGYTPPGNLWVVSAHKTLGALGQTAMLLSDGTADADMIREQTAVFGTASPSFALLASLDAALEQLNRNGRAVWSRVKAFSDRMRAKDGRILKNGDPAKLTVHTGDGTRDAERLASEHGVICETADRGYIVFMLSPHNTDEDFARLELALASIPHRTAPPYPDCQFTDAVRLLSIREAFFSPRELIPLSAAAGRVAARVFAPYPPAIPLFAPGERIDKIHLKILSDLCYTMDEPVWVVT